MYKRYYDGYGSQRSNANSSQIIVPEQSTDTYQIKEEIKICPTDTVINKSSDCAKEKSFELDDLILIGILIFLLKGSDEADPILIIVIGYLLISEIL